MSEYVDSVKQALQLVRDSAERMSDKRPDLAAKREELADALERAVERILELEALTSALPPELGNILDLPEELRAELSVAKTDELEDQIVTVINAYGGTASLDQILVGLFRKFNLVQKRRFIQNKLYRMDMVWSVEGKKGVYTTEEPSSDSPTKHFMPIPEDDGDSDIPF